LIGASEYGYKFHVAESVMLTPVLCVNVFKNFV